MRIDNTDAGKVRKSRTFWGLLAITLIYFGAYYLLVLETKACDPMQEWVAISPHWFVGFWDQYLGCRQVNELGDALAGAFAPVAFLWLAGAVHIQSQELAEQRRELNETQEVMRDQLQVSKEQVIETKASTALLKLQTDILDNQNKLRLADDEFDKTLYLIKTKLTTPESEFGFTSRDQNSHAIYHSIDVRTLNPSDDAKLFGTCLRQIMAGMEKIENVTLQHAEFIHKEKWDLFRQLFSSLSELTNHCSPAYRRLATTYNVFEINQSLEALYERLEAFRNQTGGPGTPGGAET